MRTSTIFLMMLSSLLFNHSSFASSVEKENTFASKVFILSGFEVGDYQGDKP